MWKRDSPFYLRPRPAVLPWLARFALASRRSEDGARAIRELSVAGLELHARWGEELGTSFERTGTLNVYETEEGLAHEADAAEGGGLRYEVLDADETRALEPALIGPVVGSVRYPDEGRVDPKRFVEAVGRAAAEAGVGDPHRCRGPVARRRSQAETVVVAAGAWSRELVKLPLEGGKGYHVDFALAEGDPRIPSWIQETWTIATPLPDRAATVGNTRARRARPLGLASHAWTRSAAAATAGSAASPGRPVLETWAGLRPCLPDGLPAIGRLGRVVVATGHAMKGVSLSPGHRAPRRPARLRRGAGPRPRARSTRTAFEASRQEAAGRRPRRAGRARARGRPTSGPGTRGRTARFRRPRRRSRR